MLSLLHARGHGERAVRTGSAGPLLANVAWRARLLQREVKRCRALDPEPDCANAAAWDTNSSAVGRADVLPRLCSCRGAVAADKAHEHSDSRKSVTRPVRAGHIHAPPNSDERPRSGTGGHWREQMRACALLSRSGDCGCKRNYQHAEEALHVWITPRPAQQFQSSSVRISPLPFRTGANCIARASVLTP